MRDETIHPAHEDLFAYRDGELGPEKRGVIEAHVMGCSLCRALIDQVSALEAELRQSPDRSPSGYMEALTDRVRARIAADTPEAVVGSRVEAAPERAPAGRYVERPRGERGRVKEAPKLPWAAVIGTASAAAAVLVVVVILIRQGPYQKIIMPERESKPAPMVMDQQKQETTVEGNDQPTEGMAENAPQSQVPPPGAKERAQRIEPAPEAMPAPTMTRQNVENQRTDDFKDKLAKKADEIAGDRAAQAPLAAAPSIGSAQSVPEEEGNGKMRAKAAAPRALESNERVESGYQSLLERFALPALWNSSVRPDALANAEPELRSLYMSGTAGADSARIRLYLAEAARLRYGPGDTELYEEIEHHYRRVIEMAGSDGDVARVARERLRSLEK